MTTVATVVQPVSITHCLSIDELWKVLQDAKPQISCWGSRLVRCMNGEELYLADVVRKMMNDFCAPFDTYDVSIDERLHGIEVLDQLHRFYAATDDMIAHAHIITWLFFQIGEWFGANGIGMWGPRWNIEVGGCSRHLRAFTEEQLQRHASDRERLGETYIIHRVRSSSTS